MQEENFAKRSPLENNSSLCPQWGYCPGVTPNWDSIIASHNGGIFHLMSPVDTVGTRLELETVVEIYNVRGEVIDMRDPDRLTAAENRLMGGEYLILTTEDASRLFYDGGNRGFPRDGKFGSYTDTSKVTNMSQMFIDNRIESTDRDTNLNSWDVSNVTNMSEMFYGGQKFDQDLSNWDTSNVTDMYRLFSGSDNFNQDISGWNTSKVTNMAAMFDRSYAFDQDLSVWCVTLIGSYPSNFATEAAFWTKPEHMPQWGTCPRGEDQP